MMRHTTNRLESSPSNLSRCGIVLASAFGIGMMLSALPVHATDSQVPWECSGYNGDAHTRCLQAYIEVQQEKIARLEGTLQAQQGAVGQLKEQVDRQASASADLQRQLTERSYSAPTVPPLYGYPSAGFSFSLGSPWFYGPGYYGYPYLGYPYLGYRPYLFGPRFYRHRHGPWRR